MTDQYKKALDAAEKEMAEVQLRLEETERRQAQLRATIAGLRSLMGDPSDPSDSEDMTLTDAIRTVLKGSGQHMGLAQIMVNLRLMGLQFDSERNASIGATLNRMVRTGEAEQGTIENGRVGYKWRRLTLGQRIGGAGRLGYPNPTGTQKKKGYGSPPVGEKH